MPHLTSSSESDAEDGGQEGGLPKAKGGEELPPLVSGDSASEDEGGKLKVRSKAPEADEEGLPPLIDGESPGNEGGFPAAHAELEKIGEQRTGSPQNSATWQQPGGSDVSSRAAGGGFKNLDPEGAPGSEGDIVWPALRAIPGKQWVSWPAKRKSVAGANDELGVWGEEEPPPVVAPPEQAPTPPQPVRETKPGVSDSKPGVPATTKPPAKKARKATAAEARASKAVLSGVTCLELEARQTFCMSEEILKPETQSNPDLQTYATAAAQKRGRGFLEEVAGLAPPWNGLQMHPHKRRGLEQKAAQAAEQFYKIALLCGCVFEEDGSLSSSGLLKALRPPSGGDAEQAKLPPGHEALEAQLTAILWLYLAQWCRGRRRPADVNTLQTIGGLFSSFGKARGPGYGLAGELRALLAAASLFLERGDGEKDAGLAWEKRLDVLDRALQLQRQLASALQGGRAGATVSALQARLRSECDSFFAVSPHDDPSHRLLRLDPSNAVVLHFLRQHHADASTLLALPDEAPPGATVPWYRVDNTLLSQAMAAALVGSVMPPLRQAVEGGRGEAALQEPCASGALYGFCQRDRCQFRHVGRITKAGQLSYLRLLSRQCHLSVQLASLAQRHRDLLSDESFNRIRSAKRFWFERLAEQLVHTSPLLSSPAAVADFEDVIPADVMGVLREALKDIASATWLGHEYGRAPANAGLVLKAVAALHALQVDVIPVLFRQFSGYRLGFQGPQAPLPPWLDVDLHTNQPMSVHIILTTALAAAKSGNLEGFGNGLMTYLDLVIVRKPGTVFETPYELLWLLEGLTGFMAARLRNFHNIVVPTSVVYGFLNRYPALCDAAKRRNSARGIQGKVERILEGVADCAAGLARLVSIDRFSRLKGDNKNLTLLRIRELMVLVAVQIGIGNSKASGISTLVERLDIPGFKLPEPALGKFLGAQGWQALFPAMCELRAGSLDPLVLVTRPDVLGDTPWYATHVKKEVSFQDGAVAMREKTLNPNAPAFVPTSVLLAKEKKTAAVDEDAAGGADDAAADAEAMQAAREEAEALLVKEGAAAATIQAWWKARIWKRAATEAGGASTARDPLFDATFEEAKESVATWREGREGEKARQATRYGMLYLGHVAESVCRLKKALQKLRERRKAVNAGAVEDIEEMFDRLAVLQDTEDAVLAVLKSLGPNVDHHHQLDRAWLEARQKSALEALGRASSALSTSAYTREEKRAHKRQTKQNKVKERQ